MEKRKQKKAAAAFMTVLYILGVFAAVIYKISLANHSFADFFRDTLGFGLRFVLINLTNYLPFSLGEMILFAFVPCMAAAVFRFILKIKRARSKKTELLKGFCGFAAFLCGVLFIFVFTLGVSYGAVPVSAGIGLESRTLSAGELARAMEILIDEVNFEAENINDFHETGSTLLPYGLGELNRRLNRAYINLAEEHNFFKRIKVNPKPAVISELLTRMHITGIYSFYTGEANININFPDYHLPFTAAHEMAHAMGIAREDEANFTAFLVCLYSDDSYIRYSGLLKMTEYLEKPLFEADSEIYYDLMNGLSDVIKAEKRAYSIFFDKYRDSSAAQLSSAVNDAYLKAQSGGREEDQRHLGIETYGLVRELAVLYLIDIYNK